MNVTCTNYYYCDTREGGVFYIQGESKSVLFSSERHSKKITGCRAENLRVEVVYLLYSIVNYSGLLSFFLRPACCGSRGNKTRIKDEIKT